MKKKEKEGAERDIKDAEVQTKGPACANRGVTPGSLQLQNRTFRFPPRRSQFFLFSSQPGGVCYIGPLKAEKPKGVDEEKDAFICRCLSLLGAS